MILELQCVCIAHDVDYSLLYVFLRVFSSCSGNTGPRALIQPLTYKLSVVKLWLRGRWSPRRTRQVMWEVCVLRVHGHHLAVLRVVVNQRVRLGDAPRVAAACVCLLISAYGGPLPSSLPCCYVFAD